MSQPSSSRSIANRQLKLEFVKEVQSNKELLFGKFTNAVTNTKKLEKWEEIRKMLVDKGLQTGVPSVSFKNNAEII